MQPMPLDRELAALYRKEASAGDLPLALKRFQSFLGASSAVSAMQEAAANVLRLYAHGAPSPGSRITATGLCAACDVVLEGQPRSAGRPRRGSVSLEGHSGHSGALRLDPR